MLGIIVIVCVLALVYMSQRSKIKDSIRDINNISYYIDKNKKIRR